jgi:hypothetical protein
MPHKTYDSRSNLRHARDESFSTIIDQDHHEIYDLASQARSLLDLSQAQSPSLRRRRLEVLQTLTWRLIRHDASKELVMRPAFINHLGERGKVMAQHDREDHEHARQELLALYDAFVDLRFTDTADLARLRRRFLGLMRELADHMKKESGEGGDVKSLEEVMSTEDSVRLGNLYSATLALTPHLIIDGDQVWSGVSQYINETPTGFDRVWRRIQPTLPRDSMKL